MQEGTQFIYFLKILKTLMEAAIKIFYSCKTMIMSW